MILTHSHSYAGPTEIRYLFIDGGCLRTILDDYAKMYFQGEAIELNFEWFTHGYSKVFFYDAIPEQKSAERIEDYDKRIHGIVRLIERLEMMDRFHVYLGKSHERRKRTQQKQVDMMIAIDMLKHTMNRNMHKATLLTTDSDFTPLLDALIENGMDVTVWFGRTENAKPGKDLLKAADRRIRLDISTLIRASSLAFQKKYGVPLNSNVFRPEKLTVMQRWQQPGIGPIQYGYRDEKQVIAFKSPDQEDHTREIVHPNKTFLEIMAQEEYGIVIPK